MPSLVPMSLGREQAGKWSSVICLSACLPICRNQISGDTVKISGRRTWQPPDTLQTAQSGAKSAPGLYKQNSGLKYAPGSAEGEGVCKVCQALQPGQHREMFVSE